MPPKRNLSITHPLRLAQMVADGRGGEAAIVVAQPRRVSAIALAQRVAEERGESVGHTVGYAVRGERRASGSTRILFCTTGWLIRQLGAASPSDARAESGGEDGAAGEADVGGEGLRLAGLRGLSHVIVDEVRPRATDAPPPLRSVTPCYLL